MIKFQYPYSERTRTISAAISNISANGFNTHIASVQELKQFANNDKLDEGFNTHIASVQELEITKRILKDNGSFNTHIASVQEPVGGYYLYKHHEGFNTHIASVQERKHTMIWISLKVSIPI